MYETRGKAATLKAYKRKFKLVDHQSYALIFKFGSI